MTESLRKASEYLALAETELPGTASDMVVLAVAHSLIGVLTHLETRDEVAADPGRELEPLPNGGQRVCVLCGRAGSRQFEDSPVGLVCAHVVKCAERRHTKEEEQ